MLKRLKKPINQGLAEKAAKEAAPAAGVGKFLGTVDEQPQVVSYRFEANLKGYIGWEWNVSVFQAKKSAPATVSEVVLLPGKAAIVAPAWVPWSSRRAELDKEKENLKLAVSDLEVSEDSEPDAKDASERPPIRKRLVKKLIKNKNDDKGKSPRKSSK